MIWKVKELLDLNTTRRNEIKEKDKTKEEIGGEMKEKVAYKGRDTLESWRRSKSGEKDR